MTLSDLAKYSMTRSVGWSLCDSWPLVLLGLISCRGIITVAHCCQLKSSPQVQHFNWHINEPLYSNTVIRTPAVDGWAVTFGTARRGLGGLRPLPVRAVKNVTAYPSAAGVTYYICKKTVVYTRVNGASHIENCKNYKKGDYPPAHRLSVNVLMSNSTFL